MDDITKTFYICFSYKTYKMFYDGNAILQILLNAIEHIRNIPKYIKSKGLQFQFFE